MMGWYGLGRAINTLRKSKLDVVDLKQIEQGSIRVSRNELRSLYLQPPEVPQTFGVSLILIFIEYE